MVNVLFSLTLEELALLEIALVFNCDQDLAQVTGS